MRTRAFLLPGTLLLPRAWGWMLSVEWGRRRRPFGDLLARLESIPPRGSRSVAAERVAAAVRRAYRLSPFRRSCLKESLATLGLLRSLGYPARLAIGVKNSRPPLDAHAWVEIDGIPLGSGPGPYTPLRRVGSN